VADDSVVVNKSRPEKTGNSVEDKTGMTCDRVYRQVPKKPRLACPVKYEVYLTGVGGDESAQLKNNKI